jgi:glycosyltransferase involved in cell wall biosynthesis
MSAAAAPLPRLLVLASTYPRWAGDPEPGFVHELARRLTGDFEVLVVGPHAPGARLRETHEGVTVARYRYAPRSLETLVNDGGIVGNLRRHPWKALLLPGFVLAQTWATWRAIRQHRPDVIHAHWLVPQGLVVALLGLLPGRWPPFVVTSHGADLFALRGTAWQWLKRLVVRRAAAVTVVSSAMQEAVLGLGADPATLSVQSMGVDLQHRFTPDDSQPRSRHELLFVGRLVAKKGLLHLLQAMPAILRANPEAHLTVAGFGPEEARLRQACEALCLVHCVSFLGPVEQVALPELYRRAAVFVAPFVRAPGGDEEGLGLVLVEAAGCGCPVVAGQVAAVRDVVDDPAIGVIVDPLDAEALAAAVLDAMGGSAGTPESGRRRAAAVARFDWGPRAGAYAALLKERSGLN